MGNFSRIYKFGWTINKSERELEFDREEYIIQEDGYKSAKRVKFDSASDNKWWSVRMNLSKLEKIRKILLLIYDNIHSGFDLSFDQLAFEIVKNNFDITWYFKVFAKQSLQKQQKNQEAFW